MNVFDDYTHKLLIELNKSQVEYIIVGGYAVNYHGFRRTTGDIDLWIKPENGPNKLKIIQCLQNLGVKQEALQQLKNLDFSSPAVFIDGEEPFKIDFLTHISGVSFEDGWKQKVIAEIEGISVPFLHINHLVLSKISTNRAKDKMDVEELQKILQKRNTKSQQ